MKTFQIILSLLVTGLFSTVTFSQTVDVEIASPAKPHRFSLTITQGLSISKTAIDLKRGMENSGLNERGPDGHHIGWFIVPFRYTTPGDSYPQKKETKAFYNFQARYDLTSKTGLAISWSTKMNGTVKGHERFAENSGTYLTLESKVKILTVDYIIRTGKGWSGLSVGPAIAFHNVYQRQGYLEVNAYHNKTVKPGIHLGYNLSIIKSSRWIVAANMHYNWFSKATVGPITIEDVITSVYKAQSVGLSNYGVGITTGLKF